MGFLDKLFGRKKDEAPAETTPPADVPVAEPPQEHDHDHDHDPDQPHDHDH